MIAKVHWRSATTSGFRAVGAHPVSTGHPAQRERPSWLSSCAPRGLRSKDGIEDAEEPPDAGYEGYLLRSAASEQGFVVRLKHRVAADGDQGGHEQRVSHPTIHPCQPEDLTC